MNEQLIRARAHQIWEDEGRPEGREKEHWDQATRGLRTAGNGGAPIVAAANGDRPRLAPRAAQQPNEQPSGPRRR
jgi:Protein of unknown function (DUF2934)